MPLRIAPTRTHDRRVPSQNARVYRCRCAYARTGVVRARACRRLLSRGSVACVWGVSCACSDTTPVPQVNTSVLCAYIPVTAGRKRSQRSHPEIKFAQRKLFSPKKSFLNFFLCCKLFRKKSKWAYGKFLLRESSPLATILGIRYSAFCRILAYSRLARAALRVDGGALPSDLFWIDLLKSVGPSSSHTPTPAKGQLFRAVPRSPSLGWSAESVAIAIYVTSRSVAPRLEVSCTSKENELRVWDVATLSVCSTFVVDVEGKW